MYINGSQITSFTNASYPAQNTNLAYINSTNAQLIGAIGGGYGFLDGYLAEVNFINGQQLDPSSFGSFNAATGVWQPIPYVGTYGTNGFYLPFTSNSTAAALGTDFSGNGNTWTVNNISVTAGVTYDSMTDVPTLTNATTANYCVWNPICKGSSITVSNGNLYAFNSTNATVCIGGTLAVNSGKFYYEMTITALSDAYRLNSGFAPADVGNFAYIENTPSLKWNHNVANTTLDFGLTTSYGGSTTSVFSVADTLSVGQTYMVAYDANTNKIWVGKNGTWYNSGDPVAGTGHIATLSSSFSYTPAVHLNVTGSGNGATLNAGQRPFTYTQPTGFVGFNTFNLAASTIVKGNTVMDALLYTGDGTDNRVITGLNFQPDLVDFKTRNVVDNHRWVDSVRGVSKFLISNSTDAEITDATMVTSFNSNGFTFGTDTADRVNWSGKTYVAWAWNAGSGTTSTNTAGSITSTVSVNPTAGFSVVTYTGTGATGGTVGHSLGVAPAFIIAKTRGIAASWICYHQTLGKDAYVLLNATNALASLANAWGATSPSSTTFGVFAGATSANNYNATPMVAYCWATVPGYSAFGIYAGNGSADGPFVYTGFRPKFILVKNASAAGSWLIWDTSRNAFNVVGEYLLPDTSGLGTQLASLDILSNGFKFRDAAATYNGATNGIIYAAFAENPFKNALAR
jgi:hypothetical protein